MAERWGIRDLIPEYNALVQLSAFFKGFKRTFLGTYNFFLENVAKFTNIPLNRRM